jgi:hypothetical protein
VRPMGVVVHQVLAKDDLEVPAPEDEDPIQALSPDRPDESFGEGIGPSVPGRACG